MPPGPVLRARKSARRAGGYAVEVPAERGAARYQRGEVLGGGTRSAGTTTTDGPSVVVVPADLLPPPNTSPRWYRAAVR